MKNNHKYKILSPDRSTEGKPTIQKLRKKTTLVRMFKINLLIPVLHFMDQERDTRLEEMNKSLCMLYPSSADKDLKSLRKKYFKSIGQWKNGKVWNMIIRNLLKDKLIGTLLIPGLFYAAFTYLLLCSWPPCTLLPLTFSQETGSLWIYNVSSVLRMILSGETWPRVHS